MTEICQDLGKTLSGNYFINILIFRLIEFLLNLLYQGILNFETNQKIYFLMPHHVEEICIFMNEIQFYIRDQEVELGDDFY